MQLARLTHLLRDTLRRFSADRTSLLSGAMAYFALLSLAPLLVIAVAIVGIVFGEEAARERVATDVSAALGEDVGALVRQLLDSAAVDNRTWWTAGIGLVIALYGASRVFAQLQDAMNFVWRVRPKAGRTWREKLRLALRKRLTSFLVVTMVGLLLFASMSLESTLLAFDRWAGGVLPDSPWSWRVIQLLFSSTLIAAFAAVVFRMLPDVELQWRDVWPGAVATGVLATLGTLAIGIYLSRFATTSVSGAAGAVLVTLLWIYYTANVFFLGVELTRVYTLQRRGHVQPEAHAEAVGRGPADAIDA
jgi:membrane protein